MSVVASLIGLKCWHLWICQNFSRNDMVLCFSCINLNFTTCFSSYSMCLDSFSFLLLGDRLCAASSDVPLMLI